jgi:hypothetical protein
MIKLTMKKHCFVLVLVLFFFTSINVNAQPEGYEIYQEIREARTLGEHYFTPVQAVKSPFILTYIRTSLGVGRISNIRYPLLDVGNEQYLLLQGDLYAAQLSFEYQHAVKSWLAVYMEFGLLGRLGSNFAALMSEGVNYATSFNIGWMMEIMRREKFSLSASFGVTNGDHSFISIQNFVLEIINQTPDASLVKSNNPLFGTVGIRAAYGVNELLGLNFLSDLGYGEPIQRELGNKVFTVTGINADLNFSSMVKTPVSLSLGYTYSNYPRGNNDITYNSNIAFIQLNYIGRTNFIMGLEFKMSDETVYREKNSYWLNTLLLSMRYLL